MAKTLKDLSRFGTDVRQIAKLLQKKAPPGHKLAYINEEEAAILKARGGSGRITPEGIPSYEDTYYSDPTSAQGMQPVSGVPAPSDNQLPAETFPSETPTPPPVETITPTGNMDNVPLQEPVKVQGGTTGTIPTVNVPAPPEDLTPSTRFSAITPPSQQLTPGAEAVAPTGEKPVAPAPTKPTDQSSLSKYLTSPEFAVRGASGLAQALIAANQANKARQSAQQAKTETQALATPYQQQGQQLQQAAQRGELTSQGQQAIQAAQAQAAQSISNRGGVGGMQATQQIENMRQSLLQNQMNLGLQLQQVGDKIAQGAIQAGVQADQYINTLTSNYAANIARTVAGVAPATTTTTAGNP